MRPIDLRTQTKKITDKPANFSLFVFYFFILSGTDGQIHKRQRMSSLYFYIDENRIWFANSFFNCFIITNKSSWLRWHFHVLFSLVLLFVLFVESRKGKATVNMVISHLHSAFSWKIFHLNKNINLNSRQIRARIKKKKNKNYSYINIWWWQNEMELFLWNVFHIASHQILYKRTRVFEWGCSKSESSFDEFKREKKTKQKNKKRLEMFHNHKRCRSPHRYIS